MIFALITFIAAFSIEGIGTLVSVIGLSSLFGSNPIIIALAIALDIGKLVVVSLLYKYWSKLGAIMKTYGLIAAAVTMIITSAGAAGYLSGEFQKAMVGTQESGLKVDVLKAQIAKYEERKKQIDDQIAKLPEKTTVNQRLRLMNGFKAEQAELQAKIAEIDKQLPELQIAQIGVEAKAGPILFIAKAFDISVESAVKWVILMIIFVFDPLAVFLIIAGNFLWDQRKPKKDEPDLEKFEPEKHSGEFPPIIRADDETSVNNVFIKEDGTVVRPEMPIFEILRPSPQAAPQAAELPAETGPEVAPAIVPEPATNAAEMPTEEPMFITREQLVEQQRLEHEMNEARRAGMSLEDWREAQLKKLDRIQEGVKAIEDQLKPREQITLSSLGLVRADPHTVVDASDTTGLGALDPRVRPDIYQPR